MKSTKKILLSESEMPKQWYNILADMPVKPLPLLNPGTNKPLLPEEMEPLFAKELTIQEFSGKRWHDIPEEVLHYYKMYRPTPLVRAYSLEKMLDTPARIFFKNESVSPVGSHKLNTALPQAYYNKKQGIKHLTTETGAGQWGTAMSLACKYFGLDLTVFMVKHSYMTKPYRKVMMNIYGSKVYASPCDKTAYGREVLAKDPDCTGSLGMAISEAIEMAVTNEDTRYVLGSVLNHVLLHQTIIGLEAEKQMEMAGYFPDKIIGCFGGGSNFSGVSFPFLRRKLTEGRALEAIAAEPASCSRLSNGEFKYDFGDTAHLTPLIPMYTLGNDFMPEQIHAAGLRYHGGGQIVSQLVKEGLVSSCAVDQKEAFRAGVIFAGTEGIVPAPESNHAIAVAIREAVKAKESGKAETILFNLSGHGHLDLAAYEAMV